MIALHYRPGTDDEKWVIPELVEQDIYRMAELAQRAKDNQGIAIDCGAHIGTFSALLASRGFGRPIIAFEPEPSNFEMLRQNAAYYPNIAPVCAAVGASDRVGNLTDGGGTGRWKLGEGGRGVPVIDLARLLSAPVALLKLDLEGGEQEIIKSVSLANVAVLVLEVHGGRTAQAPPGFRLWFKPRGAREHGVFVR